MLLWSAASMSSLNSRRPRLRGASAVLATAFSLLASACAMQGEGERCDPLNYNDDCESGLVCTPLDQLRSGAEGAVCCPTSNPTENICRTATFDYTEDGGTSSEGTPIRDGGATSPETDAGLTQTSEAGLTSSLESTSSGAATEQSSPTGALDSGVSIDSSTSSSPESSATTDAADAANADAASDAGP